MNVRALVLGVAIGFLVAVAPSCGGNKCGPNNCGGCCDASGKCIAKPNNANDATCGSVGNACDDCSKKSLKCNANSFVCTVNGTGGGTGGGGGSGCAGCTLPNGVCAPGNTINNCGANGATCAACPLGQLCTNNACSTPNLAKKVGDPCTAASECQMSLGATAICKTMTSSGNASYTGGYCTVPCVGANGACPTGSRCVGLDARYGEDDTFCWDLCGSGDPCRQPGYQCTNFGCWLNPLPTQDAGPPADKVGNACAADTACQNPPDRLGVCLTRDLNRTWPDGYCSKSFCANNAECSADAGAVCITFGLAGGGRSSRCIQRCGNSTPLDGGQADCRAGYTCQGFATPLPDGGSLPAPGGICVPPPAPPPENTGAACTMPSDCQVPPTTISDCLTEMVQTDAGPQATGFAGGYCSRLQCGDDSECAPDAGGICLAVDNTGQNTACFKLCPAGGGGQSNCRTGYVCTPYLTNLADGGTQTSTDGYCSGSCTVPGNACGAGRTCNATTGYCQ